MLFASLKITYNFWKERDQFLLAMKYQNIIINIDFYFTILLNLQTSSQVYLIPQAYMTKSLKRNILVQILMPDSFH